VRTKPPVSTAVLIGRRTRSQLQTIGRSTRVIMRVEENGP
jgi:hypothetical protein